MERRPGRSRLAALRAGGACALVRGGGVDRHRRGAAGVGGAGVLALLALLAFLHVVSCEKPSPLMKVSRACSVLKTTLATPQSSRFCSLNPSWFASEISSSWQVTRASPPGSALITFFRFDSRRWWSACPFQPPRVVYTCATCSVSPRPLALAPESMLWRAVWESMMRVTRGSAHGTRRVVSAGSSGCLKKADEENRWGGLLGDTGRNGGASARRM